VNLTGNSFLGIEGRYGKKYCWNWFGVVC